MHSVRSLAAGFARRWQRAAFKARERIELWTARGAPSDGDFDRVEVERDLARIARLARGHIAMAAQHLPSGRRLALDGQRRVPLASTVKIPVAMTLLALADQGRLALDAALDVAPGDTRPGPGKFLRRVATGHATALDAIDAMLTVSDNTASDVALRAAGGVEAVRSCIAALNVAGISIDRSIGQLIAEMEGVTASLATGDTQQWQAIADTRPPATRRAAMEALMQDPRDTGSPEAIVDLLVRIARGQALSAAATHRLLDTMVRCQTGKRRLPQLLAPDAVVAHKTGSLTSSLDVAADRPFLSADVGLVTLPNGRGTMAIAIFIVDSAHQSSIQDRIIARLAKRAYDSFAAAVPGA